MNSVLTLKPQVMNLKFLDYSVVKLQFLGIETRLCKNSVLRDDCSKFLFNITVPNRSHRYFLRQESVMRPFRAILLNKITLQRIFECFFVLHSFFRSKLSFNLKVNRNFNDHKLGVKELIIGSGFVLSGLVRVAIHLPTLGVRHTGERRFS